MRWEACFSRGSPPSGRRNASMQEMGGNIYLFGGRESTLGAQSDILYSWNIEAQIWQQLKATSSKDLGRYCHTQVCIEGGIYILGGQNKQRIASCEIWVLCLDGSKKEAPIEEMVQKITEIEDQRKRDDESCDVAFEVEGEIFKAHKGILEANCKYFYHMFASGMMESKMNMIKIPDVKASVFNVILEYIYSGKVELDEDLAEDLLGISDEYLLTGLRKSCEKYLLDCLNPRTLAKRIEQAEQFGAEMLKESAMRFIMENLEEISQYVARDEIAKETILEVIMTLHQRTQQKK